MKITYTSDTGKTFDTEAECREYEEAQVEIAAFKAEVAALLGDRDGALSTDGSTYTHGGLTICVHTSTLLFIHSTDTTYPPERRYSVLDQLRPGVGAARGDAATLRGAYDALAQELASGTFATKHAVRTAQRELVKATALLDAEIHRGKDLLSYLGAPTP